MTFSGTGRGRVACCVSTSAVSGPGPEELAARRRPATIADTAASDQERCSVSRQYASCPAQHGQACRPPRRRSARCATNRADASAPRRSGSRGPPAPCPISRTPPQPSSTAAAAPHHLTQWCRPDMHVGDGIRESRPAASAVRGMHGGVEVAPRQQRTAHPAHDDVQSPLPQQLGLATEDIEQRLFGDAADRRQLTRTRTGETPWPGTNPTLRSSTRSLVTAACWARVDRSYASVPTIL